ncbi:hypothetical protein AC579_6903 [Pseudocercospora musae]|uniref:BZIP domain-containing protein n=1 Tax=Pseudocercospora musae TaxID=113226 RepID=A0A139IGX3_9PEZI|nr:hypothetical protein AC579_6903 [Pseudocercospora musae]
MGSFADLLYVLIQPHPPPVRDESQSCVLTDTVPSFCRTSDLARIRDNQRRSRARRKEYLQELETKWRRCEQVGIEASAEIQAAARKVVDENKRLRALLVRHGISPDPEINHVSPASATLNSMLNSKRSCGGGTGGCAPKQQQQQQQQRNSASTSSSPSSPSPWTQQQRSPITTSNNSNTWFQLPTLMPSFAPVASSASVGSYGATNSTSPANWSTLSDPAYYDHYDLPPTRQNDASSCRDVADAIRYIRPGVGGELESEMGCQDGNDCEIPTTRAFDLMDRFSSEDMRQ